MEPPDVTRRTMIGRNLVLLWLGVIFMILAIEAWEVSIPPRFAGSDIMYPTAWWRFSFTLSAVMSFIQVGWLRPRQATETIWLAVVVFTLSTRIVQLISFAWTVKDWSVLLPMAQWVGWIIVAVVALDHRSAYRPR